MENNRYSQAQPGRMSMMKFQYDDLHVIFCDEISMVGSMKLAKINYRLQDMADGSAKNEFMGGISFVASGKLLMALDTLFFKLRTFWLKLFNLPSCYTFRGPLATTTNLR